MADLAVQSNVAGLAGVPCWHIGGASDAPVRIEDRYGLRCHFQPDKIPQVLHNTVHIHHIDDAFAHRVCAIHRGIDLDCAGFNVLLR